MGHITYCVKIVSGDFSAKASFFVSMIEVCIIIEIVGCMRTNISILQRQCEDVDCLIDDSRNYSSHYAARSVADSRSTSWDYTAMTIVEQ